MQASPRVIRARVAGSGSESLAVEPLPSAVNPASSAGIAVSQEPVTVGSHGVTAGDVIKSDRSPNPSSMPMKFRESSGSTPPPGTGPNGLYTSKRVIHPQGAKPLTPGKRPIRVKRRVRIIMRQIGGHTRIPELFKTPSLKDALSRRQRIDAVPVNRVNGLGIEDVRIQWTQFTTDILGWTRAADKWRIGETSGIDASGRGERIGALSAIHKTSYTGFRVRHSDVKEKSINGQCACIPDQVSVIVTSGGSQTVAASPVPATLKNCS